MAVRADKLALRDFGLEDCHRVRTVLHASDVHHLPGLHMIELHRSVVERTPTVCAGL
jgi:hypothetical protein